MENVFPEDNGQRYGAEGLVHRISHEWNALELDPLLRRLQKHPHASVADWGGGNGILAKEIIDKTDARVRIIDIDDSKFIEYGRLENVRADVTKHRPEEEMYDFSLTRNVLHYMPFREQSQFIENIMRSTKHGILLINYVHPEESMEAIRIFEQGLQQLRGVRRYYSSAEDVRMVIEESQPFRKLEKYYLDGMIHPVSMPPHWFVHESVLHHTNDFDLTHFFEDRFKLSQEEVGHLESTLTNAKGCITEPLSHGYDTLILYLSPRSPGFWTGGK